MQVEWIPVTERLPRESEYVLATVKEDNFYSYVACAYMSGGKWRVDGTSYLADVTAWAQLPEPYKED